MKKAALLIIASILIFLLGCGKSASVTQIATPEPTTPPNFDFRSVSWGMTIEEVKQSEKLELLHEGDADLLYSSEYVAGLPATIIYRFQNQKLVQGSYTFDALHSNANDYIDDYNNIKEALTKLYGNPLVDEQVWKDDLFKDDPSSYGLAVSAGQLLYATQWETETTAIVLGLSGDNYEISHFLFYTSFDYESEINTDGL